MRGPWHKSKWEPIVAIDVCCCCCCVAAVAVICPSLSPWKIRRDLSGFLFFFRKRLFSHTVNDPLLAYCYLTITNCKVTVSQVLIFYKVSHAWWNLSRFSLLFVVTNWYSKYNVDLYRCHICLVIHMALDPGFPCPNCDPIHDCFFSRWK